MFTYRVVKHSIEISKIEIERLTTASVWIKGTRYPKSFDYTRITNYFDEWKSAKAFLMLRTQSNIRRLITNLERENENLVTLLNMKEPE